jgi:hypothetical protein
MGVDTGKIRMTKATIEDKRSRFARAGIDIRTIDTEDKLERAMNGAIRFGPPTSSKWSGPSTA